MKPRDIIWVLIAVSFLGGNFTATKLGLKYIPPLLTLSLRMMGVALFLIPFVKRPSVSIAKLIVIALCNSVGHLVLITHAVHLGLPVSVAVIIQQLSLPIAILIGILFLKETLSLKQFIGICIAFIGIVIVVGSPHLNNHFLPYLLVLGSATFFAIFNILIKTSGSGNALSLVAWSSLFSIPPLLILAALFEPISWHMLLSPPAELIYSIGFLVLATVIGFGIWFNLMQKYPVNIVMPFGLLIPVSSIISAHLMFDEPLTAHIIIGSLITIAGIAIINTKLK